MERNKLTDRKMVVELKIFLSPHLESKGVHNSYMHIGPEGICIQFRVSTFSFTYGFKAFIPFPKLVYYKTIFQPLDEL